MRAAETMPALGSLTGALPTLAPRYRIAERMAKRCSAVGIEIALVSRIGLFFSLVLNRPPNAFTGFTTGLAFVLSQ